MSMQARIKHPVFVFPEAYKALMALHAATEKAGVPAKTFELMHLRASQINGCAVCLEMHVQNARKLDESDVRLATVAAWRESSYFSDAERAALALTEALTRVADRVDPVPDDLWNEAARHYDETQLSALLLSIAQINVWNRLNIATRQIAGVAKWG